MRETVVNYGVRHR